MWVSISDSRKNVAEKTDIQLYTDNQYITTTSLDVFNISKHYSKRKMDKHSELRSMQLVSTYETGP